MPALFDGTRHGRWLIRSTIPASIGLGAFALSSLGSSLSGQRPQSQKSAISTRQAFPLAIRPDPIMVGVVQSGKRAETWLSVHNTQHETVTIERIETSCPCVVMDCTSVRLGPHEATDLKVTFEPSEDPDFEGYLSIEVTGYLADGSVGFLTNVNIQVAPR